MRDEALLATKLFVPPPRFDLVPRPRLDERLTAGLRRKLTLLAAPAGFGKTTVLCAWRAGPAGHDVPLAWVSLDAGDNDPVRFWSYVATALDTLHPGAGGPALDLLLAPQPPPGDAVVAVLVNGLASLAHDVALVLDDYHTIETGSIHQSLTFLLDRLPPRLHLILASRADPPLPLARLRARGEMAELRATDLRFTPAETGAFLAEVRLPLTAADVAALTARTEGWIAALQLAALSLQDHEDAPGFVSAFAGSHRYVVDYLAEEVLGRQPAEVQTFLLETAILARLNGPLCDAVTGRSDGQEMLERLERANLFTVPLDEERQWYRYHHLFAEFLLARLTRVQPERLLELHDRAAIWYERAGSSREAVRHALAAMNVDRAADLIEATADFLWMNGELTTLLGWLEALPREIVLARPRLAVARAGTHFLARTYDTRTIEVFIAEAEAALAAGGVERADQAELRGVLAAIETTAATTGRDIQRALVNAHRALDLLPAVRTFWRVLATVSLGVAQATGGDPSAGQTLVQALALSEDANTRPLVIFAIMNLAWVRAGEGKLREAAALCRRGLTLADEHGGGGLPVTISLHVGLGKLSYEWNDLTAATHHLEDGLARIHAVDEQLRGQIDGFAALARVRQARGDTAGADELLRRCSQVAETSRVPWARSIVAAYRARLDVQRGELDAAIRWAEESGPRIDDDPSHLREYEHLTLARVLIARGDIDLALHLLERQRQAATQAGRVASEIETRLLESLARQRGEDDAGALAALEAALALAEPEGYIRLFVDEGQPLAALLTRFRAGYRLAPPDPRRAYVERLLAACAPSVARSAGDQAQPLPEPLTPREREVLTLIAEGLSNSEIAARLFVTVGTVKTYVNGIFGKLEATSRTQAVARARTTGLLANPDSAPR